MINVSAGVDFGKLVAVRTQQLLGDRYRLLSRLGSGGMSVVWTAHDEVLDRPVAVKVLSGPRANDPAARRRIHAEARAAAKLRHPNVTSVYDYGETPDDSSPYVVMELLPGHTLSARLAHGPLPPRTALRICAEVAAALSAAHSENLVHRDVKPGNVMLTPDGAKVVDFGIAAIAGQRPGDETGQILGTPAYLAPERLTSDDVTPASDVYALGLLIYRALTDNLPWEVETTTQMLTAHAYIEPTPLPPIDGVPPEVTDVCNRCLAKDPANRPTAAEVAAVLATAAGLAPATDDAHVWTPADDSRNADDTTVSTGPHGRRTLLVLAAGSLVVLVVAVATTLAGSIRSDGDGGGGQAVQPGAAAGSGTVQTTSQPGLPAPTGGLSAPGEPGAPSAAATPGATGATPPPAQSTPPARPSVPVTALGGTVHVVCTGRIAEAVDVDVNPGYEVTLREPGPANLVRVVFVSPGNESDVKARCDSNGTVIPDVKERPRRPARTASRPAGRDR